MFERLRMINNLSTEKKPKKQFIIEGSLRTNIMAIVGMLLVLSLWQFITWAFGVPEYLVPSPMVVGIALKNDFYLLLSNSVPTITEAFLGFLLGNTIALIVAVSFVYNKLVEEMFYPVAILIKTIPIVAIAPVLKIILGNGLEPKIVIAALISFFPTLVNAVRGFRAVNPELLELMHVLSASQTQTFRRVRLYASLPYIFSALKISVTMCVLGAIVGEWIGANAGLGYLLIQSMFDFNAPRLFATILTASSVAIFGFAIVTYLETKIINWNAGEVI